MSGGFNVYPAEIESTLNDMDGVAELPRNTMGKVQKNLLREAHKGLFAA